MKTPITCAIAYIACGFLTWGWLVQRPSEFARPDDRNGVEFLSLAAGVCWPIYWTGRVAMKITAP